MGEDGVALNRYKNLLLSAGRGYRQMLKMKSGSVIVGWPALSCCLMVMILSLVTARSAFTVQAVNAPSPAKEITAVVLDDFPPLYSLDESGRPAGFAIDILNHLAKALNVNVRYLVVQNWAEAMESVRTGEADLIPGIGISPARSAEFLFTEKIETIPVSCFVRYKNFSIKGIESLSGRRVAVIGQSAAETRLKKQGDSILIPFSSIEAALIPLLSGDVDAFVFPEPVLWQKVRLLGIEDKIKVVGKPLMELKRGLLLRKNDTERVAELNAALSEYTHSDAYLKDYARWYGQPEPFWTIERTIWAMLAILVVVVVFMSLWRYRGVLRLNRQLQATIAERIQAQQFLLESEARFRGTFEQAAVGVAHVAPDGKFLLVNQRLCDLLGYSGEQLLKLTFQEITHPDDLAADLASVAQMLAGTIQTYSMEKRYFRPDGEIVWANLTVSLSLDAHEKPDYFISIVEDISRRKQLESEVNVYKEDLEKKVVERTVSLQKSLEEIKTLKGILPLCSFCKKIRNKQGDWEQVDVYIHNYSEADISHSVCPDCMKQHYSEYS